MIIVDKALAQRAAKGRPIRLALFGAGFSARNIAMQIFSSFPSIELSVVVNRTPQRARDILELAGAKDIRQVDSVEQIQQCIASGTTAITDDMALACATPEIDAVIETTGEVAYGCDVALAAIDAGKHTFLLNCEADATVGPMLKVLADRKGVVYSNSDGDEPGVAMNLSRHVRTLGLEVVGAGNLKGFYDPYRTPTTQAEYARIHNMKPKMVTSFIDGTKLSMECTVLANGLGASVAQRGMQGPPCDDVRNCLQHFPDDYFRGGRTIIDYVLGASPYTGAFVIGHTDNSDKQNYLQHLKMGDGPCYVFYTPFHLPQLEIPITVARGVLLGDAAVTPVGRPYCDAITIAKTDLAPGDRLDGLGGYHCYSLIEDYQVAREQNLLPIGIAEDCIVKNAIKKDSPLRYDDVELSGTQRVEALRLQMEQHFADTSNQSVN